jgi:YHS domain-containing protein
MKGNIMHKLVKLLFVLCLVSFVAFVGCKKDEPVGEDHSGHDHAMGDMDKAMATVAAAVEQTTCPVMGGEINKDIFVEYKGKKVYFCCAGCEGKFEAEPEKYLSLLPQFE